MGQLAKLEEAEDLASKEDTCMLWDIVFYNNKCEIN